MKPYTFILPDDVFSHDSWQQYDKYTKQIKSDYVCEWLDTNLAEVNVGLEIYVPDSTNIKLTYLFKVADINNDNIVTLEWVGSIK